VGKLTDKVRSRSFLNVWRLLIINEVTGYVDEMLRGAILARVLKPGVLIRLLGSFSDDPLGIVKFNRLPSLEFETAAGSHLSVTPEVFPS